MEAILQALSHTPTWVYIIFFYCIFIGKKSLSPNKAPLVKLLVLPVLFNYLSYDSVRHLFPLSKQEVFLGWFFLAFGVLIGYLVTRRLDIKYEVRKKLFHLSGSWTTLFFILLVFGGKYYFGYSMGADPEILKDPLFAYSMLAFSIFSGALFIGRLIVYLTVCFKGPYLETK